MRSATGSTPRTSNVCLSALSGVCTDGFMCSVPFPRKSAVPWVPFQVWNSGQL